MWNFFFYFYFSGSYRKATKTVEKEDKKEILALAFKVIDDPDFKLWYTRSKAQA